MTRRPATRTSTTGCVLDERPARASPGTTTSRPSSAPARQWPDRHHGAPAGPAAARRAPAAPWRGRGRDRGARRTGAARPSSRHARMTEGTAHRDASRSSRHPSDWARRSAATPAGTASGVTWRCPARGSRRRSRCWPRWRSSPASPRDEVERLRDERLNDLLQARPSRAGVSSVPSRRPSTRRTPRTAVAGRHRGDRAAARSRRARGSPRRA